MPANPDFEAPRTTAGGFAIPQSPVVVPGAAPPVPQTPPMAAAPAAPVPNSFTPGAPTPSAAIPAHTGEKRGIAAWLQRMTLPQDDGPNDLLGRLLSSTPPWFV